MTLAIFLCDQDASGNPILPKDAGGNITLFSGQDGYGWYVDPSQAGPTRLVLVNSDATTITSMQGATANWIFLVRIANQDQVVTAAQLTALRTWLTNHGWLLADVNAAATGLVGGTSTRWDVTKRLGALHGLTQDAIARARIGTAAQT